MTSFPRTTVTEIVGDLRGPVAAALAGRANVVEMTQAAEEAVLRPHQEGRFPHGARAAIACRISVLHGDPEMAARYRGLVLEPTYHAICDPNFDGEAAGMGAECAFVDKVAARTRFVTAEDISALQKAGIADADIVRLSELVAFMAYQLRLIAGLRLMNGGAK